MMELRKEENILVIRKNNEEKQYKLGDIVLKEVTKQEIYEIRKKRIKSKKSGIIIKIDNSFYFCDATLENMNILFNIPEFEWHCCNRGCETLTKGWSSKKDTTCKHLIANLQEEGGCPKVLDRFYSYNNKELKTAKRIEKYDFIKYGYEIIGLKEELCVIECKNYERGQKPVKINRNSLMIKKRALREWSTGI